MKQTLKTVRSVVQVAIAFFLRSSLEAGRETKIGLSYVRTKVCRCFSFRCIVLYSCLILFFLLFLSFADEMKLLKMHVSQIIFYGVYVSSLEKFHKKSIDDEI